MLDVSLKFRDSTTLSTKVITLEKGITSIENEIFFPYEIIYEIRVHKKNDLSYTYYILESRLHYDKGPSKLGMGRKIYNSSKLELFRIYFGK